MKPDTSVLETLSNFPFLTPAHLAAIPAEIAVQERAVYMQDVQDLASTFYCKILLDVAVQDTWNILQHICCNKNVSFGLHFSF